VYLRVQPFIVLRLYEGIHVGPNKKMALRIRRYDRKYEGTFEGITSCVLRKYFCTEVLPEVHCSVMSICYNITRATYFAPRLSCNLLLKYFRSISVGPTCTCRTCFRKYYPFSGSTSVQRCTFGTVRVRKSFRGSKL